MKKIYIVILTLALGACSNELEIEPSQSLSENVALNTDQNVKKAVEGAYDALSGFNGPRNVSVGALYGGDLLMYSELMASDGELNWTGTFNQIREIFGKQILVNNGNVLNQWAGGYNTINICNNVLESVDVVFEEDRDRVKGDALFIRGVVYLELVRFFALPYSAGSTTTNPGVPLVLTSNRDVTEESLVSRATVEAVYQQVISDLTQAEQLLPEFTVDTEADYIFATKTAAAAMLSRVYMDMANYSAAADAANRVIESEFYTLAETYAEAFNTSMANTSEDIFSMQVNDQDGNNSMNLYYATREFGGRGDIRVTQKHLDLYEAGDERLDLFYFLTPQWRVGKWKNQFGNVGVVRLAEMYLTRAEANFREGSAVGGASPADDINLIRERVGLDPIDAGDLTLDIILHERKVELAHEGETLHDLKRLKGSADGFNFDDPKMVFPIPIRETNINKNLEQNPGYGEI